MVDAAKTGGGFPGTNPHNYVPERFEPRSIAIIGGNGAMGTLLAKRFRADGYRVALSGVSPSISPRELRSLNEHLIYDCDVTIFSVPAAEIKRGIPELVGRGALKGLREKLFLDVTSVKCAPVAVMSRIPGPVVIGTHPMFGPAVDSFRGQNVFVCPVIYSNAVMQRRAKVCLVWVEQFFARHGANIIRATPEKHDEAVTHVQFAVLAAIVVYMGTLRRLGADMEFDNLISTPNSRLLTALANRIIRNQTVDLYANISIENPNNIRAADALHDAAKELKVLVEGHDKTGVSNLLRELAEFQPVNIQRDGFALTNFVNAAIANRERVEAAIGSAAK